MCMMCNCSSKGRGTMLYIFVSICGDGVFVFVVFFRGVAVWTVPNVPLTITVP